MEATTTTTTQAIDRSTARIELRIRVEQQLVQAGVSEHAAGMIVRRARSMVDLATDSAMRNGGTDRRRIAGILYLFSLDYHRLGETTPEPAPRQDIASAHGGPAFSRTEFRRRMRSALAEYRRQVNARTNWRVEIGTRTVHQVAPTLDAARSLPEAGDLDQHVRVEDISNGDPELQHGSVVHVYLTSGGTYGELETVGTIWIGTPDQPAAVLTNDNG